MDLTSPFNFDLAGLQLVYTPQGIMFAEKIQKGHKLLANVNFDKQELANNLGIGGKPTYQLVCANGNTVLLGAECKVYTQDGWKEASELTDKDLILHKLVVENHNQNKGGIALNYQQKLKTNAMPIYVPKKNSPEFSEWIGIFLSCGHFNANSGRIWILSDDEIVVNRYYELTEKVFRLQPIKTKNNRENRKTEHYFISQNIINFLRDNLGQLTQFKKIPAFLLEGSNDEHLALIKGLSSGASVDGGYLHFYKGPSKNIADCVSLILRNNGYVVYQKRLDYRKSSNNKKDYYIVQIMGKSPEAPQDLIYNEEHRSYLLKPLNMMVDIKDELSSVKLRSFEAGYSAYKKMIKENRTMCSFSVAESFKIDMNKIVHYYSEISSIKLINHQVKQVSLKVLYPEGFLFNNIVLGGRY